MPDGCSLFSDSPFCRPGAVASRPLKFVIDAAEEFGSEPAVFLFEYQSRSCGGSYLQSSSY
jgi:hypothetical protein